MVKVNETSVGQILEAVGGKDNIVSATHCISRLRLQLVNITKVNTKALARSELVKGSFYANEQFQIVIGQGTVDRVYDMFVLQVAEASTGNAEQTGTNLNIGQKFITLLSDVFVPLLPAIVASGLLLGVNNVLTGPGIFNARPLTELYPSIVGVADIVSLIAGTAFAFLPALVSWSVVKRFGGNPLMGIVLGLVLVHPDLLNGYVAHNETPEMWQMFGISIAKVGYQGQVLPAIAAGFVYVKIEAFFKRLVPDALQLLFVSTLSLLLSGLLAFVVIGPVTYQLSTWITASIVGLSRISLPLSGVLFGGLFSLLAMSGMHHAFLAVNIQLIATAGSTLFWPVQALSDLAQGTAAFTVALLNRKNKLASIAYSAGFSAYLGITEPAMFAVNLKTKYSFLAAMIGAASGGGFIASFGVSAPAIGVSGMLSFLAIARESWQIYIIGMCLTVIVTAGLTVLFAIIKNKYAGTRAVLTDEKEVIQ